MIKQATINDIDILTQIAHACDDPAPADYFKTALDQRDIFMIYPPQKNSTQAPIAAGYAMLNWQPAYHLFRRMAIPEIQDLCIIPDHRRQGLAQILMQYCEDIARNQNREYMGVAVSVSPKFGPAQRLYSRQGYHPDGFGATYDRKAITQNTLHPIDDNLCLMLIKTL